MKILLLLLLLGCGCGSAETTASEPCPPHPQNCAPCSPVFLGKADPATACRSQVAGCELWGPLGGCSCSKCPAECGCVSPKNSEPCLSCMKASCSPELNACLSDK